MNAVENDMKGENKPVVNEIEASNSIQEKHKRTIHLIIKRNDGKQHALYNFDDHAQHIH